MPIRIEYKKGEILGKHRIIFLEDILNIRPRKAEFQCSCGSVFISLIKDIKNNKTTSCGCYNKTRIISLNKERVTHGLSNHSLFGTYANMMNRVYNFKNIAYPLYKDRLVEKYLQNPKNYIKYIEALPNAYGKGLTVDREDNDLGYIRGNLRWANGSIQAINQNKNKNNITGYVGIFLRENGKYRAFLAYQNKSYQLGTYPIIKEAVEARNKFIVNNNLPHPIQIYKEDDGNKI